MISLWAFVGEADVEAYASSLVLPEYLAHLGLAPFRFRDQAASADGQEPLRLVYSGEGRLEEHLLWPREHALGLLCRVCPGIKTSKIRLPQDDARWHWDPAAADPRMRIYFEPATRLLYPQPIHQPRQLGYVSVTRGHLFVAREAVEGYLRMRLETLGIDAAAADYSFDTALGGVHFSTLAAGGQMLLGDQEMAEELIRFAGIERALAEVGEWAELDLDRVSQQAPAVRADGVYLQLAKRDS